MFEGLGVRRGRFGSTARARRLLSGPIMLTHYRRLRDRRRGKGPPRSAAYGWMLKELAAELVGELARGIVQRELVAPLALKESAIAAVLTDFLVAWDTIVLSLHPAARPTKSFEHGLWTDARKAKPDGAAIRLLAESLTLDLAIRLGAAWSRSAIAADTLCEALACDVSEDPVRAALAARRLTVARLVESADADSRSARRLLRSHGAFELRGAESLALAARALGDVTVDTLHWVQTIRALRAHAEAVLRHSLEASSPRCSRASREPAPRRCPKSLSTTSQSAGCGRDTHNGTACCRHFRTSRQMNGGSCASRSSGAALFPRRTRF